MQGKFEMSMMGELNFFLGLQVKQVEHDIFLCQAKYCRELLKKFNMENCKEAFTLIATGCYLDADETRVDVDQTKFRQLIGSLMYLTTSRPDIMFSVYLCTRFQAKPKESHYVAPKIILKYLKGTTEVGLWYPSGTSMLKKKNLHSATCHRLVRGQLVKKQFRNSLEISTISLLLCNKICACICYDLQCSVFCLFVH